MKSSVWPIGKERAARLEQFHASAYFPGGKGVARNHGVSPYWEGEVANLHTVVGEDSIKIVSPTAPLGPQQLQEERERKLRRQTLLSTRTLLMAGRLGTYLPRRLWSALPLLAKKFLRHYAVADEARARVLGRRAFLNASRFQVDPICSLDSIGQVPVLAQLYDQVPLYTLYVASIVNVLGPHIRTFAVKRVMEIGPNWGVLAIALRHFFGCRFILIDLPEVINCAFSLLSFYAPDAVVVLPHEVDRGGPDLERADFVLLCPEQASCVASDSMDLAINTSSFQEMTHPIIEEYFRLIKRCLRDEGLFYCLNMKTYRPGTKEPVAFESYPWDPEFRDLVREEFGFGRWSPAHARMSRLQMKCVGGGSADQALRTGKFVAEASDPGDGRPSGVVI